MGVIHKKKRDAAEGNRLCYPVRPVPTSVSWVGATDVAFDYIRNFKITPNNIIPPGKTVMGICGSGRRAPTLADWQSIRNYFMKLNDKLGGNRKYPIKYN